MMKSIRGFMKILVAYLCLSFVYTYSYSILNSSYLQEKENLQLGELSNIEKNFSENIMKIDSYIMRRHITRIVNVAYSYGMNQNDMKETSKKIMKKNGWLFVEKEIYQSINREKLIFKKEGYECKIDFYEKNRFRITLTTDDIYNRLNW